MFSTFNEIFSDIVLILIDSTIYLMQKNFLSVSIGLLDSLNYYFARPPPPYLVKSTQVYKLS